MKTATFRSGKSTPVEILLLITALLWPLPALSAIQVDRVIPGGNIICKRVLGGHVYLQQELRGTPGGWFYWAFRVNGAEGRRLVFHFTNGEPVGTRGPAVSNDRGMTWRWLNEGFTRHSFVYKFSPDETEVWFSFGMVYTQLDWEEFLSGCANSPFIRQGHLTTTDRGRPVEALSIGCIDSEPRYKVMFTARHHACEMMASYVLEGVIRGVLSDQEWAAWLRENVEFLIIPFVDKDGVEEGDQGKGRAPRDHNRDYSGRSLYQETAAIRSQVPGWLNGKPFLAFDLHCPWIRGGRNETVYQVGMNRRDLWRQQQLFGSILEELQPDPLGYSRKNDLPFGKGGNTAESYAQGRICSHWAAGLPNARLVTALEIPYATASGREVNRETASHFGMNLAVGLYCYLNAQ